MSKLNGISLLIPLISIAAPAYGVQYVTVAEAQKILFPEAVKFSEQSLILKDEQRDSIKKESGTRQREDTFKYSLAKTNAKTLGYFIVDEVVGKHEFITYAVGIDMGGQVIGIEILDYRETHGGQIRDVAWRKKFAGKKVSDPFQLDVDVPNISGATLSSRNVLDGVKRLLVIHKNFLRANASQ